MISRFETVIYGMEGGVAEIRLNRPDRLNAVVEQLYDDLLAALDAAESDPAAYRGCVGRGADHWN